MSTLRVNELQTTSNVSVLAFDPATGETTLKKDVNHEGAVTFDEAPTVTTPPAGNDDSGAVATTGWVRDQGYITLQEIPAVPVQSVAGKTGDVTLSTSDISGLAASATTDTTDADNISSGTLGAERLPATGVEAGTYSSVTVDVSGRVTAGSNPAVFPAGGATGYVLTKQSPTDNDVVWAAASGGDAISSFLLMGA